MARKLVTKAQGRIIAQNITSFGPWNRGVDESKEPFLLSSDEMSDSGNVVMDDHPGLLNKRPGTGFVAAVPFLVDAPKRAYVFKTSDGREILLLTDNRKLVYTEDLINFVDITPTAFLTAGEFAGGDSVLDFATAESLVWFTNGTDPVCSWDGTAAVIAYDSGIAEITWDAGTDTQTTIADALLDRVGDGTTWVGKTISCISATNTGNIGQARPVTVFVDATNTITFGAFPFAIVAGDKFAVGVEIPRGRYIKYHHSTLFVASTPENVEEVRFHNDVDPNEPGTTISIGNPFAWPPVNQFVVGSGGDRIWGFTSPVYRNRIGVFKSTGLYRIEPDATFRFLPVTITEQFGSRFPASWQQKGDSLIFLGEDTDGRPDVMLTDFVSVKQFNRKHARTLDALSQPRTIFRDRLFNDQASWDSGSKSTLLKTENDVLEIDNALVSIINQVNIDTAGGAIPRYNGILGHPLWDQAYVSKDAGGVLPRNTDPAWLQFDGTGSNFILEGAPGSQVLRHEVGPFTAGSEAYVGKSNVFDATKTATVMCRANIESAGGQHTIGFGNGQHGLSFYVFNNSFTGDTSIFINGVNMGLAPFNAFVPFKLTFQLDPGGAYRIWLENTILFTGTTPPNADNGFYVGETSLYPSLKPTQTGFNKRTTWHAFAYAVDTTLVLGTLPLSGEFTQQYDYTRTPDALRIFFHDTDLQAATVAVSSWSSDTSDFSSGNDPAGFVVFANGTQPTSLIKRYLRIKFELNIPSAPEYFSPNIKSMIGGSLWLSPAIQVGVNISRWLNFISNTNLPALTVVQLKLRYATVATPPTELDYTAFVTVTTGQNIGTVTGDVGLPPSARWIQIKAELGPNPTGASPEVASAAVNWFEGASVTIPVASIIYNKKWLLSASTGNLDKNDTIVVVDPNDAFHNWGDLETNVFVWFKNKLYINRDDEILELTSALLSDDGGDDGMSGRILNPILAFVETNQEIGGAVSVRKKPRYVDVASGSSGQTMIVSYKRDDQAAFTALATVPIPSGYRNRRINVPLGFQFHRLILRVENNEVNRDFGLNGLVMFYSLVPSVSGL